MVSGAAGFFMALLYSCKNQELLDVYLSACCAMRVQIKWLYLTVDVAVVQLNTELCQLYTKCIDCIRDPHCGWNIDRCQQYESGYDTLSTQLCVDCL